MSTVKVMTLTATATKKKLAQVVCKMLGLMRSTVVLSVELLRKH